MTASSLRFSCAEGRLGRVRRAGHVRERPGLPAPEAHSVGLPSAVHRDVKACGQGVDDRGAHPVEAAGSGVRGAAELASGVQLREDDLDSGQAGARLRVDRDASPVVPHLDRAVRAEDHLDVGADPGQCLVDRVVDDLPQAVHQPALVGRADVHAGALADGLETLEDLQVACGVVTVA